MNIRKINIKVKTIEFDFTGGGRITKKEKQEIIQQTLDTVWEIEEYENEPIESEGEMTELLIDRISNETEWLVDDVTYDILDVENE